MSRAVRRTTAHPRRQRHTSWAVAGALVVGTLAWAGATQVGLAPHADAAEPGQRTVGRTTVALTQPADNLLGRMTPSADAADKGMFAPQVGWPVIPINVSLASNGHLISYGTPLNVAVQGGRVYDDWDPAYGTTSASHTITDSMASYDSFCNNLVTLADGRMLMVGGNGANGSSDMTMYYDPISQDETMGPGLTKQRWYATALRRPDDKVLVVGGGNYYAYTAYQNPNDNSIVATTPEIGDGIGRWSTLTGAASTKVFGARDNRWWYPRAYNAPDGSVFGISGDQLWRMTTTGRGSLSVTGTLPTSMGVSGSSVMYAPGKILVAGGNEVANGTNTTATNAATVVDINGSRPQVTSVTPMAARRNWLNLTVLPTGDVLSNGGTVVGTNGGAANSSYTAEVWNPGTRAWRTAATATRIRTYHSSSVLMPSGAVFTGGGGVPGPEDNFNSEMYYPSYLFTKRANGTVAWADRPTITSISGDLTWGGKVVLGGGDARKVASVSLVNAGSVTHSENTDQRRIPLSFTQNGGSLTATLPADANAMPPGTYLLSTTDANGVPSPSQLVTVKRGGAGTVNVNEVDRSAGRVGGPGTMVPGVVPLTEGSTVSFEAADDPAVRLGTTDNAVVASTFGPRTSTAARMASGFVVRAGLAGSGRTFESAARPGWYLTLQDGRVVLAAPDGSGGFAGRATWKPQHGLQGNYTSFASYATPTLFLRKQNGAVVASASDGSDQFRADATFGVRPPLGPAAGWYSVRNTNSNLALSVQGNALAAGTLAVQDAPSAALTQDWELRPTDDGHYRVVDGASGLVLGVTGGTKDAGGQALVWGDNGTLDHLWDVYPRAGHWMLRNVNSGLVLGVTGMSKDAGGVAVQWGDTGTADHYWDLGDQGASATAGTYRVASSWSGLSLDTANGTRGAGAVQAATSGAASQQWRLADVGNGTFVLRNAGSGYVLGVDGASKANGAAAVVWDDNGTADHLWRVVASDGRWLLVNANSNQVLGIDGGSKAGGARVVQWADNGTPDHLWTLTAG